MSDNKEKRAEVILDALDYLDDDMIESVDKLRKKSEETSHKKNGFRTVFRYNKQVLAVAASVCLLFIGAYAWENGMGSPNYNDEHKGHAPSGTEVGNQMPGRPEYDDTEKDENVLENTEADSDSIDAKPPVATQPLETESSSTQEKYPVDINPDDTSAENPDKSDVSEEEMRPSEPEESVEPDECLPLGDVYQLLNNYVKVTMLPNKAWSKDATLEENFMAGKEIEEKYYATMDSFVEELCTTPLLNTDFVMGSVSPEVDCYHLFFQRTDGKIVQVCIFDYYGFVYFGDTKEYGMKIDGDILAEVLKVLWTKW